MAENLIIAKDVAEALSQKDSSSAFLAGGTEINRLGSTVEAKTLVSIGRIAELDGISVVEDLTPKCKNHSFSDGNVIRIGSMCTFQDVVENELVPDYLKQACLFMASRTKRNMATIGGNVALKRDDSYIYPTLLAAGARLELKKKDGQTVYCCTKRYLECSADYEDCLIMAVLLPVCNSTVISKRYANTAQSHAVLTVSAAMKDGQLSLAVGAKNTCLAKLQDMAAELQVKDLSDEQILALVKANAKLSFKKDIFGSPEYKSYLLAVTIADLVKAVKEASR